MGLYDYWQWKLDWKWKIDHLYMAEIDQRPRHGHKCIKDKICLGKMMIIFIKQHFKHHLKIISWKS